MTVEAFLILLSAFSVVTSLFTEAVKRLLESMGFSYASDIVVLGTSVIVGGLGTCFYYVLNNITFDAVNITFMVLMVFANWLVAMLGYDKVMQAVKQIKG